MEPQGVTTYHSQSNQVRKKSSNKMSHMQLEQRLAHIRFIPETQTNPLRKTDREAIADRNSSYTKKKLTFPLTIIQQSFLWLCLDTSSKVKVLDFEPIFFHCTQKVKHTQISHQIQHTKGEKRMFNQYWKVKNKTISDSKKRKKA